MSRVIIKVMRMHEVNGKSSGKMSGKVILTSFNAIKSKLFCLDVCTVKARKLFFATQQVYACITTRYDDDVMGIPCILIRESLS